MLALTSIALSGALETVFQVSEPRFVVLQQPPLAMLNGGIMLNGGLEALLNQLTQQMAPMAVRRAPPNPCAEDMRRLNCKESSCLKGNAETLNPACAAFLLGDEIKPSPMPEAADRDEAPRPMRIPTSGRPQPQGYFTMMTTDSEGAIHRSAGPIPGPRAETMMRTAMTPPSMSSFFPPEILSMMRTGMMALDAELAREEEEEEEEEEESGQAQHPCAREVSACTRETRSNARPVLEQCLVAHFEQLSPECRCFVHHLVGSRPPTAAMAMSKPPAVAAAALPPKAPYHPSADDVIIVQAPTPMDKTSKSRHLSCLFVALSIFMVVLMLTRLCMKACCRAAPPRPVVLVPPETMKIQATSHPEAKVEAATTAPLQVAEPVHK